MTEHELRLTVSAEMVPKAGLPSTGRPRPNVTFYDAKPDKNGEVRAGELNAARFLRFNPATEAWIE